TPSGRDHGDRRPAPNRRSCSPGRRWSTRRSREGLCSLPGMGRMLVVAGLGPVVVVRADRDQLVHRVEIVDEQLALEMVQLVLQRATEQPGTGDLDLLPLAVLGDDPDLFAASDVGVVARQREAALEVA